MRPKPTISIQRLKPAINAILARHPTIEDAAPELRRLAIKHRQQRYKVFAAYTLLKQKKDKPK